MRISTKGQYALEAMLALALAGTDEKISIRQIGEWTGLSDSYLEQIFALLKKARLVKSNRGNKGGYQLAAAPESITAGDILRASEGSLAPVRCTDPTAGSCADQDLCLTQSVWKHIDSVITREVNGKTLAELASSYRRNGYDQAVDFVI
ncbi:MAG: Rrf2 family transcriptional regulator [Clostridiaceae bacterium]|nr:Rrf2 family transcriptional regulator [Clostridiaceae bacterium]